MPTTEEILVFIANEHDRLDKILKKVAPWELANQAGWSLQRRREWFKEQGISEK